jgi:hypothetical membrane protein
MSPSSQADRREGVLAELCVVSGSGKESRPACRSWLAPIEEVMKGRHRAGRTKGVEMSTTVSHDQPVVARARTRWGSQVDCTPEQRVTRSLLGYGIVAGPFYVAVSLAQAAVRDGFDLTRHEWSLLANGTGGWIQITNLILTGLMVVAAAVGYRRALGSGVGRRAVPVLLAAYGVSLVAAGAFRADPMGGFPLGTPDGPPVAPTLHGTLHMVSGGVGFLVLIIATLVLARRFRREGRTGRAIGCIVTGVAFLTAFVGIASGAATPAINLAFTAAVLLVWGWLCSTSAHLYKQLVA